MLSPHEQRQRVLDAKNKSGSPWKGLFAILGVILILSSVVVTLAVR